MDFVITECGIANQLPQVIDPLGPACVARSLTAGERSQYLNRAAASPNDKKQNVNGYLKNSNQMRVHGRKSLV